MTTTYTTSRTAALATLAGAAVLGWLAGMPSRRSARRAQHEAQHQAGHDALTGLANRRGLYAASGSPRLAGAPLLYLDLTGFKAVNDTHGHEVGDRVLCRVADVLDELVPAGSVVARLGGDEFVVVLADDSTTSGNVGVAGEEGQAAGEGQAVRAELLAGAVATVLAEPFVVAGRRIVAAGNVGVAAAGSFRRRLADAEAAMYRAKRSGDGVAVAVLGEAGELVERPAVRRRDQRQRPSAPAARRGLPAVLAGVRRSDLGAAA